MSSYGYVPYDHNKRVPDSRPGPRSPEEGAQSRGATPASSQDAASGREGRRDRARGRHRAGRGDWTPAGQSYGVAPRTSASHGAASQGPPSGPTASKPAPPLSLPGSIPPPDAPRPAPPAGAPRPAFRPSAPDSAPPAGAPRVVPPAGAGAPRVVPPAGAPGPAPRSRAPGAPRVVPPPGAARPAGAPPLVSAPGGYGVVPVPGVGGNSGAGGYGGPGAGGPGPADRAGAGDPAGSPRKADLEWWERLGARLRSWRALVVLRRIQAVVVWASLPVILVALMVNETLRISLGACWGPCGWCSPGSGWRAPSRSRGG